jgi:hypothetical protein
MPRKVTSGSRLQLGHMVERAAIPQDDDESHPFVSIRERRRQLTSNAMLYQISETWRDPSGEAERCKEISGGTEGVQRSRQSRRGTGSWDEDEGVVLISAAGRRRKPSGRVFA